jgi:hypothetical protein
VAGSSPCSSFPLMALVVWSPNRAPPLVCPHDSGGGLRAPSESSKGPRGEIVALLPPGENLVRRSFALSSEMFHPRRRGSRD